jgi:transposase
MGRPAIKLSINTEDRSTLESWIRSGTTEQRLVFRASVVLASISGKKTVEQIAREFGTRPATVHKWLSRFREEGLSGLRDAHRSGKPTRYTHETEKRILEVLDEPAPDGYASWNGPLVAARLGDVSVEQVWRVLRRHGISLQRRRSWCISTDPEFAAKAADIVGIYLNPPENAVVLCVDEKPHIQALERAQGYLKFKDGRALTGFSHEYKRHGTSTLFAALNILTGKVSADHYKRRRRIEFLDFMNQVVAEYPGQQIHVVLDNLKTHKPKHDKWIQRNKNVVFHYTPTHASWLNMVECWFSMLSRHALRSASFLSVRELRDAIDRYIVKHNEKSVPFVWRKTNVRQKQFVKYAYFCN